MKAIRLYITSKEHGRTQIMIRCPECKREYEVYLWSFAGCGKKCDCGVKLG